jgi:hypothetical protein
VRERKFGRRVGLTSLVALCAIAAFAVIGGTGLAGGLANPGNAQYGAGGQYHGKVTICHKGHVTIRVAMVAWFRAHQHHGDTMGPCSAAAVKAAKLKAAKVKAAKLKGKHSQVGTEDTAEGKAAATSEHKEKHGSKGKKQKSSTVGATQGAETPETHGPPAGHGNGNGNGNGNGHGKNG